MNFLRRANESPRPLAVARDEALPLYVQANRAKVAKKGETLEIAVDDRSQTTARFSAAIRRGVIEAIDTP